MVSFDCGEGHLFGTRRVQEDVSTYGECLAGTNKAGKVLGGGAQARDVLTLARS